MCLIYNNQQSQPISRPNNFKNIFEARIFAYKHAKIVWFENKYFMNHICIFKIPNNVISIAKQRNAVLLMYNRSGLDTIDLWSTYYETVYSRKILAINIIQRALKKAISNPYTPLCKRRLINEFYNL